MHGLRLSVTNSVFLPCNLGSMRGSAIALCMRSLLKGLLICQVLRQDRSVFGMSVWGHTSVRHSLIYVRRLAHFSLTPYLFGSSEYQELYQRYLFVRGCDRDVSDRCIALRTRAFIGFDSALAQQYVFRHSSLLHRLVRPMALLLSGSCSLGIAGQKM